jgi:hypothetical protein
MYESSPNGRSLDGKFARGNQISQGNVLNKKMSELRRAVLDAVTPEDAEQGRVFLTLDSDFWNDRKHPLHSVLNGVIYIAEPPDQYDRIMRAFGLIYGCFARNYPLDWRVHMKVKGTVCGFDIKSRDNEGKVARYRMKLRQGYSVAKELKGSDN